RIRFSSTRFVDCLSRLGENLRGNEHVSPAHFMRKRCLKRTKKWGRKIGRPVGSRTPRKGGKEERSRKKRVFPGKKGSCAGRSERAAPRNDRSSRKNISRSAPERPAPECPTLQSSGTANSDPRRGGGLRPSCPVFAVGCARCAASRSA